MDKTIIGMLFITAGAIYGSLALDGIYNRTLGYLVEHEWLKPPVIKQLEKNLLGRKATILFYSAILIIIGVYILYAQ
ncbi:MAG: hypothetical protein M1383_05850 [Patescibacteria group bacterium]|nr:hypothetical protein [Patescibacteria group bacterium]